MELTSGRRKQIGCLSAYLRQRRKVFECLRETKQVKRVSTGGEVIVVTFSIDTSSHLVLVAQVVSCLCPVENLFVIHLLTVLIAARGDSLHIHNLSRENYTTDCLFPLLFHRQYTIAPSARLSPLSWGDCITFIHFSSSLISIVFCGLSFYYLCHVKPCLTVI